MREKRIKLCILDENGSIIAKVLISDLEMLENKIIEKSKELYNTTEPCIIYRTCIINEMHSRIWEKMKSVIDSGKNSISKKELLKEFPELLLPDKCEKIILIK